ncbi:MAG: creatininase family protein [Spirochaetes bacterium]|nr:creatininase family protein [Spirochaetota bacterium]
MKKLPCIAYHASVLIICGHFAFANNAPRPFILQEMTWVDVRDYLKKNDMVIIPLGSTEQHGPHLPLGADFYEALEIAKRISEKTGVIVAPLAFAGYSESHMGFPGTISVKTDTLEQYVFECVRSLIAHGFKKILFFNFHGGNNIVQANLIHRINHTTSATAIAIGIGGTIRKDVPADAYEKFFDWHAGLGETSLLLFLTPELVRMERVENPTLQFRFTKEPQKMKELFEKNPGLAKVWEEQIGVPEQTGKGGASHEFSSNGIWSLNDVTKSNAELGKKRVDAMVQSIAEFIEEWKKSGSSN